MVVRSITRPDTQEKIIKAITEWLGQYIRSLYCQFTGELSILHGLLFKVTKVVLQKNVKKGYMEVI